MTPHRDSRGRFQSGPGSKTSVKIKDNSAAFIVQAQREMMKRLKTVGVLVSSEVKRNISTSTRAQGPSEPGEFIHADTGRLRSSVGYKVNEYAIVPFVSIGTPVFYGKILEDIGMRLFLRATVQTLQGVIRGILTSGLKQK